MIFETMRSWWRRLPQKVRVQLIASVLLIFAGTEVFVLAPYIFEIAVMIDIGGLVVVLAALRSSASVSTMQLRALGSMLAKPLVFVLRVGDAVADLGSRFPRSWYRYYFLVDRFFTRGVAAALVVTVGLALTKAFIEKP